VTHAFAPFRPCRRALRAARWRLPHRCPDYLRFANGAFAGCSIPDLRARTYRSGVGW